LRESRVVFVWQKTEIRGREGPRPGTPPSIRWVGQIWQCARPASFLPDEKGKSVDLAPIGSGFRVIETRGFAAFA
jgi:hypothetical protein